jgi:hypothetical protein
MTPSIIDTQHNNALPCAECLYAECCILFTIVLNVVMLSVVAPSKGPILNITEVNYCKPYYCLSIVKLEILYNDRLFLRLIFKGISRLICSPPFSILTIHYLTAAHYLFLYNDLITKMCSSQKLHCQKQKERRADQQERHSILAVGII